jgi:hypothetical protein
VPERAPVEQALQVLEEGFYDLGVSEIRAALADLGLDVADFRAFSAEVLKEAGRRTGEALRGLWEALEVPPPVEVDEALQEGLEVSVFYPACAESPGEKPKVKVHLRELGKRTEKGFHLPPLSHVRPKDLSLRAWGWWIRGSMPPGLFFGRSRVSFRGSSPNQVRRALRGVRALRPLFTSLGLSDLEEALEALEAMAECDSPQAQLRGSYVLARKERSYTLRRGSIFGDLSLDAYFLLGERVEVSTQKGVRIVLEPSFSRWERWDSRRDSSVGMENAKISSSPSRASISTTPASSIGSCETGCILPRAFPPSRIPPRCGAFWRK